MPLRRTRGRLWRPVLVAALAAIAVAGLGASLTDLGPWYQDLKKPSWQPPDWLFGPAWTIIFALCAIAGVLAWRHARSANDRGLFIGLFALNGFLNILWSDLFFHLHRPDWALFEVPFLWVSVLLLMIVLRRASRLASWLLLPYLVWVAFAGVLNWTIVQLNPPFGG